MKRTRLVIGVAYFLDGLPAKMWDVGHPKFGKPRSLAGVYCGSRSGHRTWHIFEILIDGEKPSAIVMSQDDLDAITVSRIAA